VPIVILARNPLNPGGLVLIEDDVLDALEEFRQLERTSPESGGILLGFRRGPHLHVVEITAPQPDDTQSRTAFHRKSKAHQKIALARWAASGSRLDYVGEWHSHPESNPMPSGVDWREWRAILALRTAPMLFLILGTSGPPWLGVGAATRLERVVTA
jgi:integrative and conjugative element protein (TIGR02256 family)